MDFFEKFLAAWLLVILAIAGMCAVVGIFFAGVAVWAWLLGLVPGWAQCILNILAVTAITALIVAVVEEAHSSDY